MLPVLEELPVQQEGMPDWGRAASRGAQKAHLTNYVLVTSAATAKRPRLNNRNSFLTGLKIAVQGQGASSVLGRRWHPSCCVLM